MNEDKTNNTQATLPPLPGSDKETLRANEYDSFYKIKPRELWDKNQIVRETPEEFKKCKHHFAKVPQGAECKKCHMGLIGYFEIQNGQLYHEGEAIRI